MTSQPATSFAGFMMPPYKMKEKDESRPYTNTRIGDTDLKIFGGSYHIPSAEYTKFLRCYYAEIVAKKSPEYLTEVQLPTNGPILVDVDFRFPYDCEKRTYTDDHIADLINLYLDQFKFMYQFDEYSEFSIYVLEKAAVNRVAEKQITKDGIHIVFGISAERKAQVWLRSQIVANIGETWSDLEITNTWEDVFDSGFSTGGTNWQLYGSSKPNHAPYRLTKVYKCKYDPVDGEFQTKCDRVLGNAVAEKAVFELLSARCSIHPTFFHTGAFISKLENIPDDMRRGRASSPIRMRGGAAVATYSVNNLALLQIRNMDDLVAATTAFLDNISSADYIVLRETYDYVMALPPIFYESGSYNRWIRVGWALRNTDDRLFIAWIAMSAKASGFSFSCLSDLYDQWIKFDIQNKDGLTKQSIMYWVKEHAREKYNEIRLNSVEFKIDQCLGRLEDLGGGKRKDKHGCGDYDIAEVLYTLKKSEFVCTSIKGNIWYQFKENRWVEVDSGTTLRKSISNELRNLYTGKATKLMERRANLNETDHADEIKKLSNYIDKLLEISQRLACTNDKKNIMTEAKELFFDHLFMQKLDNNPQLMCFKNGVVDFKSKTFRKGHPEDYVSKCTNIDYIPLDTVLQTTVMTEIETFMHQLFPVPELYTYMWEHLASTLVGTSGNQTFNMYIGVGQNGKSVLVSLMERVLGEYKGDVPLSLITDRRTRIGGLAPELVALKGIRYAVMQEPSKDDAINEGVMKQLTSGIDPIQARAPYMPQSLTFIPQFKLVVCSNEFMTIKTQDHGTWRRIRVVDFMSLFTDKPVSTDPSKPHQFKLYRDLKEKKFDTWKTTFAAMLVAKVFETGGTVNDCPLVLASSNSYRERQDYIAEFIADKIVLDQHGSITKIRLNMEFKIWFETTYGRSGGPSPKDVQAYLDKKYQKCPIRKVWLGVRFESNDEARSNSVDSEDIAETGEF